MYTYEQAFKLVFEFGEGDQGLQTIFGHPLSVHVSVTQLSALHLQLDVPPTNRDLVGTLSLRDASIKQDILIMVILELAGRQYRVPM